MKESGIEDVAHETDFDILEVNGITVGYIIDHYSHTPGRDTWSSDVDYYGEDELQFALFCPETGVQMIALEQVVCEEPVHPIYEAIAEIAHKRWEADRHPEP